jgi:SAM-dependent methyltransferase
MDDLVATNRRHWDAVTPGHVTSQFYDLAGFKAGRDTIDSVETAGVGDVAGKTLLHLQCHFGLDTMSWTRRGALATGIDFSEVAVDTARALAAEVGLATRFEVGNVLEVDLEEQFDVVFTSHGVLGWLPELESWGRTIARHLEPGHHFFVADSHPCVLMIYEERTDGVLAFRYDYFDRAEIPWEGEGSYADARAPRTRLVERLHPLEDVVMALLDAGLAITNFREYPYLGWQGFAHMVVGEDGWWRLPDDQPKVPMMFSIAATKPS